MNDPQNGIGKVTSKIVPCVNVRSDSSIPDKMQQYRLHSTESKYNGLCHWELIKKTP